MVDLEHLKWRNRNPDLHRLTRIEGYRGRLPRRLVEDGERQEETREQKPRSKTAKLSARR